MTDHNYERLVKRVDEIEPLAMWPYHVGAALGALIPAIGFQLIPWLSTFPSLPLPEQVKWGWVTGFMVASILFSLLGIGLCVFAAWRQRGRRARDKASVLEDMRDVQNDARAYGAVKEEPPGV